MFRHVFAAATLLEYAGVHYFTKVGSGERFHDSDIDWEDIEEEQDYGDGDTADEDSEFKSNHTVEICMREKLGVMFSKMNI